MGTMEGFSQEARHATAHELVGRRNNLLFQCGRTDHQLCRRAGCVGLVKCYSGICQSENTPCARIRYNHRSGFASHQAGNESLEIIGGVESSSGPATRSQDHQHRAEFARYGRLGHRLSTCHIDERKSNLETGGKTRHGQRSRHFTPSGLLAKGAGRGLAPRDFVPGPSSPRLAHTILNLDALAIGTDDVMSAG